MHGKQIGKGSKQDKIAEKVSQNTDTCIYTLQIFIELSSCTLVDMLMILFVEETYPSHFY